MACQKMILFVRRKLMRSFRQLQAIFVLPVIVMMMFVFGWMLQQQVLFNRDVGWLLEASKRLLAGGTYLTDFFENNPPWILYLYSLPVLITNYFSTNIIIVFQLCVFALAMSSWLICATVTKTIFHEKDARLAKLFLVALAWVFVILPAREFGQREHLLVILTLPYCLLVTSRLYGTLVSRNKAILVGVFAGAGFLLKPYFVPTFLLIELYYMGCKKQRLAWARPEVMTTAIMAVIYAIVIVTRHHDYLTQVVPFASRWCGLGAHDAWSTVLYSFLMYYSMFAVLFYLATNFDNRYQRLTMVLFVALAGFLISYLIQQTTWYYHQIPALSILILFYSLLFGMMVTSTEKIHPFIVLFILVIMCLLLNLVRMYIASYYTVLADFFGHVNLTFYISMSFVFIGGFFIATAKSKWLRTFYAVLAVVILAMPILNIALINYYSVIKKNQYAKLTEYINQHAAGQRVYFMTTEIEYIYPTLIHSKAESASRFSYFWALGGMVKQAYLPMNDVLKQQLLQDKQYFINMVSDDIRLKQPKLIFIDTSEIKNNLYFSGAEHLTHPLDSYNLLFNYLDYFSENVNFRTIFSSYRYLTSLVGNGGSYTQYPLYQFDVYERV